MHPYVDAYTSNSNHYFKRVHAYAFPMMLFKILWWYLKPHLAFNVMQRLFIMGGHTVLKCHGVSMQIASAIDASGSTRGNNMACHKYRRCCFIVQHLNSCNLMIMTRSIFIRHTFNHEGRIFLPEACHCGKTTQHGAEANQ